MNPLIMERDEETPETIKVSNDSNDSMTEITLSERSRLSETDTNRMDWLSILWQSAVLTVTGVAVCLVFNYIS